MNFKKATSWDKPFRDLKKLSSEDFNDSSIGGWFIPRSGRDDFYIVYTAPYESEDHYALLDGPIAEMGIEVEQVADFDQIWSAIMGGMVRFVIETSTSGDKVLAVAAGCRKLLDDFVGSLPSKSGWMGTAEYIDSDGSDKFCSVSDLGLRRRGGMRPNPPKNIDTEETLGGECAVWALAAASGRTVQDVRRAFLDAGIDIWTEDGLAKGTELERMRRMVQKLDLEKRITYIGYSYPTLTARSKRALYYTSRDYTSRFMHGKSADDFARTQAVEDGFQFPPGTMSGANRATVGQVLRKAKRERLAAIVVTGRVRLALRKIEKLASGMKIRHMGIKGVTHVLGYSPSLGVYDTAASIPNAVALERFKDGNVKLGDWHRHGQEIPDPSRPALLWVYFKGE